MEPDFVHIEKDLAIEAWIPLLVQAERLGYLLAEAGYTVICGGYGGTMEAACRGAKAAGGLTIGVLPGTDADEANPYIDIPIVTGMGEARNVILVRSAAAIVAVGGSYGTLSEIAHALRIGVPVVALASWEIERSGHPTAPIRRASGPTEAAALALQLASQQEPGP